ncbi:MAG: C25 family cysteine peptidase [Planctomycetota bacterium]
MRTLRGSHVAVALPALALVGLLASSARSSPPPLDVAGWCIYVKEPGVVRIPIADMPGRALCPVEGSPVSFLLTSRNETVPYWVNDKRTLLCFWGEPDLESHDARGRCYRLREGDNTALCVSNGKPVIALADEEDLADTGKRTLLPRETRSYEAIECLDVASLTSGARPGGNWFYEKKLTFESDTAAKATLRVKGVYVIRLQKTPLPGGRVFQEPGIRKTDPAGTVTFEVNGTAVEKKVEQGAALELPIQLQAGTNTVKLLGDRAGLVLVQRAEVVLDAPVTPGAAFVAKGPTRIASTDALVAYDIDAGKLLEVKKGDKASVIKAKKGSLTLVFDPMKVGVGYQLEPYAKHDKLVKHANAWAVIAPRALLDAVKPLAEHRASQGLRPDLYAFEDLCHEYTDGTFSVDAIEKHLSTYSPDYVLLVGDSERGARPTTGDCWLPTYHVDTYQNGASATDRPFAPRSYRGHSTAIGRFPCRTKEEVAVLVAKTIAYEKAPATSPQRDLAFVCGEGRFGPMVDGLIENLFTQAVGKRVPASFDIDVTYANPTSVYFYPPDDFAKRVVERISAGPLIFDYIGHGATESLDTVHWEKKRFPIFTAQDAEKVSCPEGRYPIALITACWTGCFDQPERTVGEALLLNPKGAVAVLAASRISHPFANALLSLDLTESLFRESDERLGTRIRKTLDGLSLKSGGAEGRMVVNFSASMLEEENIAERLIEDERHLYNLLGDPALVIRLPRRISVDAPAEAPAGKTVEVKAGDAELAALTLERVRAPRGDLAGLDAKTGPDSMKDAAVVERVRDTYRRANDLVLATGTLDGARGMLALPRELPPGKYVIKLTTRTGAVGSAPLVVKETEVAPKKKYY